MHQIAVEQQYRARLAGWRDDTALGDKPGHCLLVQRPQRIRRGDGVVAGLQHALRVAARNQHQRAVDRHHLIEEHRNVHRPRLRHAVVARPGAVILVPLPDVAVNAALALILY